MKVLMVEPGKSPYAATNEHRGKPMMHQSGPDL